MRKPDNFHGLLLVNKAAGMSSHAVVDRLRGIISQRSVGHAGTLDPAAEGLLLLMLGKATKVARFLSSQDKQYEAEIRLGLATPTYDAESVETDAEFSPVPSLDEAALERLLDKFRGTTTQKVPPFSAVQVDGQRLYKLARKGETVQTPEREVTIHSLKLTSFESERMRLLIDCSKGTYIRSLAHDLGQLLGCGGHLSFLRRTRVGKFNLTAALSLEQVEELMVADKLNESLLTLDQALDIGSYTISDTFRKYVCNGRQPNASDIDSVQGKFGAGDDIYLKDSLGVVLAIGTATMASDKLEPGAPSEPLIKYHRVLA